MNTLNSKFIEELGWELNYQDEYFDVFKKIGTTDIFFTYEKAEGGTCLIYTTAEDGLYDAYFVGKIKNGQFLIDLLESIF